MLECNCGKHYQVHGLHRNQNLIPLYVSPILQNGPMFQLGAILYRLRNSTIRWAGVWRLSRRQATLEPVSCWICSRRTMLPCKPKWMHRLQNFLSMLLPSSNLLRLIPFDANIHELGIWALKTEKQFKHTTSTNCSECEGHASTLCISCT